MIRPFLGLLALLAATPALAQSPMTPIGAPTFATGQSAVGTAAGLLAPTRPGRISVTVQNFGSSPVYVGPAGVTPSTGMAVAAGQAVTIATTAPVFGVVASGSVPVAVGELY